MQKPIQRGEHRDLITLDPIKITSPEQFVPLYLITESPSAYYRKVLCGTHRTGAIHINGGLSPDLRDRETVKEIVLEQLNQPYPNEYSLSMGVGYDSWTGYDDRLGTLYNGRRGTAFVVSDCIVKMGLGVIFERKSIYTTMKTRMYHATEVESMNLGSLKPQIVWLIKAKHIPMLRARYYLKLKYELNLCDTKVLVSDVANSAFRERIMSSSGLEDFIIQSGLNIQEVPEHVIASYLYPPISPNKPVSEYLKDARKIAEEVKW